MRRTLSILAVALLSAQPSAVPAFANEGPTIVKVALTDMSSAVGGWRGAGSGPAWGMMGPGMMGYGWGGQGGGYGMGPGMMGYGWGGPGGGYGMGPGMMGNGGPGQGYGGGMGPGMMMGHGMMAIRVDHESVKAGEVKFDITNWSRGLVHEMLVIPVANPQAPLPYDYAKGQVAENQVKVLGDTGDMQPNASSTLDVTLPAGNYLLICNIPGHYASGMVTSLTVTP